MVERFDDRPTPHLDPGIKYTVADFGGFGKDLFPPNLQGKRVLEIGASQSDYAYHLRQRGADAYTIDPAYAYPKELDEAVNYYLNREIMQERNEAEWYIKLQEARAKFREDQQNYPDHYLPAVSTRLPFRREVMDFVYSLFCICPPVSARDYQGLVDSINETLRVLKVGGKVIIYPFDNHEDLYHKRSLGEAGRHQTSLDKVFREVSKVTNCTLDKVVWPLPLSHPLRIRKILRFQKTSHISTITP